MPLSQVRAAHMGWNAHCVAAPRLESLGDAKGRFDLGDRVAHDEMNARGAAELVEHAIYQKTSEAEEFI